MSTPTSSRETGRDTPKRPSTPDQRRPAISRTGSYSVAPKSEYLRNALQARRAQNGTPTPLEMRPPPPFAPERSGARTSRESPDIFAEYALTEEQTAPVSPIRRRRPSDAGRSASKTSRELSSEIERLKDSLMTTNVRVVLLKKDNSDLQRDVTSMRERVEELEPLEDENHELRNHNAALELKMQEMEEEMSRLADAHDDLQKSNEDLLAINVDCVAHCEDQESAVQEAADTIIALEMEKIALADEVRKLKKRMTALEEDTSTISTLVDGSPRCPLRVCSIDESRPNTSHFDSDYYSQPDSPQRKTDRESVISITPSERSKKFLALSAERRQSARDLVKRMSAASLKALKMKSTSPAPEVPQIPEVFQQQVPQIVEPGVSESRLLRTPRRSRDRKLPQQPLIDALEMSPSRSDSTAPRSPAPQPEGLRGLYRPDRSSTSDMSNDSRSSIHRANSPATMAKPRSRQPSYPDVLPIVPSRASSKHAHTSTSSESLPHPDLRHHRRRQSESDMGIVEGAQTGTEEWETMPPPPVPVRTSLISNSDLTTEPDTDDKDRWWRSVERLNKHQHTQDAKSQLQHDTSRLHIQYPPLLSRSQSHHVQIQPQPQVSTDLPVSSPTSAPVPDASGVTVRTRSRRDGERRGRTQPSIGPGSATPPVEKDFLFNENENEETFMRKAKARLSLGSRRRE